MSLARKASLASLLLVLLLPGLALSGGDLRRELLKVYDGLLKAEREGADVAEAALKLDRALKLINEGGRTGNSTALREAERIISEVRAELPSLMEEGRAKRRLFLVQLALGIGLSGLGGVLAYLYAPRLVWRLWLKARRDWKVRKVARR